ncbi:hypothetical protein [Coleofasciculus sp. H7-2]|uniref:hypothetical protein n=1 Tax=Coleofasciculus sp. H7-2 TaxID=3351545 RepID=UPI003672B9FE
MRDSPELPYRLRAIDLVQPEDEDAIASSVRCGCRGRLRDNQLIVESKAAEGKRLDVRAITHRRCAIWFYQRLHASYSGACCPLAPAPRVRANSVYALYQCVRRAVLSLS